MDLLECCHGEQVVDGEPECNVSGRVFESTALTTDHLTSTPLFDAILQGDWSGVNFLLQPGSFRLPELPQLPEPFHEEFFEHDSPVVSTKDQAATWVVCNDEHGKYLWRQLPLHAAICYGAPIDTIQGLVEIYPDGLCSADTNGNLPLHLAIQFNSSQNVILHLLQAFPEALHAENGDGQLPLQCGTNKAMDETGLSRIRLLQTFMDCKNTLIAKECESKQNELEVLSALTKDAASELDQAKAELQELKEATSKRRFGFGVGSWRKRSDKIHPE